MDMSRLNISLLNWNTNDAKKMDFAAPHSVSNF